MPCSSERAREIVEALRQACQPRSPARQTLLVDRVDPTRCKPNQEVIVGLDSIPMVDKLGRIAHLRGIYLACKGRFTSGGANDAVTAHALRGLFRSMYMTDRTGHDYLNALDFRQLIDDVYFRCNYLGQWPPLSYGVGGALVPTQVDNGIAANVPAGTIDVELSSYFPLVSPRESHSPFEGMIPVQFLVEAQQGGFRFTIGSVIPGNGSTPIADLTFNKLIREDGQDGMDVYADVVYLPALVVDSAWAIYNDTYTKLSGLLNHWDERTDYAWVRYLEEDDFLAVNGKFGLRLAENYSGISVQTGGTVLFGGLTQNDWFNRTLLQVAMDPQSSMVRQNASLELPLTNALRTQSYAAHLIPSRGRETSVQGGVNYNFQSRDCTTTRVAQRTSHCMTNGRMDAMRDSCGVGGCGYDVIHVDGKGQETKNPSPGMPQIVVPKRLPRMAGNRG